MGFKLILSRAPFIAIAPSFGAVLAVNYKEISPLDFSHSNIITVFNQEGELYHQKEGLGIDSNETIEKIKELDQK